MAYSYKSIADHPVSDVRKVIANYETNPDTGCMEWLGYRSKAGYGTCVVGKDRYQVHRVAYELSHGPIPPRMVIDHLCRNRRCINPAHLDQCSIGENVLRGDTIAAKNMTATHCKRGHEFTPDNTTHLSRGHRVCRTCSYAASKVIRAANKPDYARRNKEWRLANAEHLKKAKKSYYMANRDRILAKMRLDTAEKEVLRRIWDSRKHACEVCGVLVAKTTMAFAHVLPKGAYPEFRLREDNIFLLCSYCHDRQHYYGNSLRTSHKWGKFFRRKDELMEEAYPDGR